MLKPDIMSETVKNKNKDLDSPDVMAPHEKVPQPPQQAEAVTSSPDAPVDQTNDQQECVPIIPGQTTVIHEFSDMYEQSGPAPFQLFSNILQMLFGMFAEDQSINQCILLPHNGKNIIEIITKLPKEQYIEQLESNLPAIDALSQPPAPHAPHMHRQHRHHRMRNQQQSSSNSHPKHHSRHMHAFKKVPMQEQVETPHKEEHIEHHTRESNGFGPHRPDDSHYQPNMQSSVASQDSSLIENNNCVIVATKYELNMDQIDTLHDIREEFASNANAHNSPMMDAVDEHMNSLENSSCNAVCEEIMGSSVSDQKCHCWSADDQHWRVTKFVTKQSENELQTFAKSSLLSMELPPGKHYLSTSCNAEVKLITLYNDVITNNMVSQQYHLLPSKFNTDNGDHMQLGDYVTSKSKIDLLLNHLQDNMMLLEDAHVDMEQLQPHQPHPRAPQHLPQPHEKPQHDFTPHKLPTRVNTEKRHGGDRKKQGQVGKERKKPISEHVNSFEHSKRNVAKSQHVPISEPKGSHKRHQSIKTKRKHNPKLEEAGRARESMKFKKQSKNHKHIAHHKHKHRHKHNGKRKLMDSQIDETHYKTMNGEKVIETVTINDQNIGKHGHKHSETKSIENMDGETVYFEKTSNVWTSSSSDDTFENNDNYDNNGGHYGASQMEPQSMAFYEMRREIEGELMREGKVNVILQPDESDVSKTGSNAISELKMTAKVAHTRGCDQMQTSQSYLSNMMAYSTNIPQNPWCMGVDINDFDMQSCIAVGNNQCNLYLNNRWDYHISVYNIGGVSKQFTIETVDVATNQIIFDGGSSSNHGSSGSGSGNNNHNGWDSHQNDHSNTNHNRFDDSYDGGTEYDTRGERVAGFMFHFGIFIFILLSFGCLCRWCVKRQRRNVVRRQRHGRGHAPTQPRALSEQQQSAEQQITSNMSDFQVISDPNGSLADTHTLVPLTNNNDNNYENKEVIIQTQLIQSGLLDQRPIDTNNESFKNDSSIIDIPYSNSNANIKQKSGNLVQSVLKPLQNMMGKNSNNQSGHGTFSSDFEYVTMKSDDFKINENNNNNKSNSNDVLAMEPVAMTLNETMSGIDSDARNQFKGNNQQYHQIPETPKSPL